MYFRGRGTVLRVDIDGFSKYSAIYNRGIEGVQRDLNGEHIRLAKKLKAASYKHFMDHARRDDTSWSAGGTPYRTHRRATGKFFGPREIAFHSVVYDLKTTQGFGWPNIDKADKITDGAWRSLELGLPPGRHRMPPYVWIDREGNKAERGEGGVIFAPTGRTAWSNRGGGIDAWNFLRDGFHDVVKMEKMTKTYREIFRNRFKRYVS